MRLPLLLALVFASVFVRAQEDLAPDALVRKVTAEVLDAIHKDDALKAGDRNKALALAEEKVLPHVDFREMTRLAAGKIWLTATPAQQDQLVHEFRTMIIRTYATAIDAYSGQTMRVLPLRMPAGATEVTVRNQYIKPGKPPVPVDYQMIKTPAGWKIADITVEGISLVLTYRSEFDEEARRTGLEGLIARLVEKNRSGTEDRKTAEKR